MQNLPSTRSNLLRPNADVEPATAVPTPFCD